MVNQKLVESFMHFWVIIGDYALAYLVAKMNVPKSNIVDLRGCQKFY